ncbi:MAG: TetR/AcrR family transcriptional regulator [Actinomycetota bacterium]|nr:TetR/AcrR family transcriptional regulator [Actinomycetota bacterium]
MPPQQRLPRTTRRRQLLDVALPLFGARGFHDTSMEDIAETAGVTKPVVYQHFSSKRELYLELLATVGEDVVELIAGDAARQADPQLRVKAGFVAYFGWVREHPSAFNLLFGGSARQEDGSAAVVAAIEDRMASALGELIDAGVDGPHRELLGHGIVGLGEITARHWVARNGGLGAAATTPLDPAEADVLAERLANLVWAGLRSLPGAQAAASRSAESRRWAAEG